MLCCGVPKKAKRAHKNSDLSTLPVSGSTTSQRSSIEVPLEKGKDQPDDGVSKSLASVFQTARENDLASLKKIMAQVFGYLAVNDLLKLRRVSKPWNTLACEILREKMEGVIILQRGLGYYTRAMSSSFDIPIGRIFLNILDMDEPQPKNFFRTLGHTVYRLVLNLEGHSVAQFQSHLRYLKKATQLSLNLFNGREKEDKDLPKARERKKTVDVRIFIEDYDEIMNSEITHNSTGPVDVQLYNLESIILSCESNWKSNEPLLLQQLLQSSPNLKNLNLTKWPFPLKSNLFDGPSLEHLQFLTLTIINDDNLKALGSKRLRLKSISMCLDQDVESETFDKFLDTAASTLQYIRIDSKSDEEISFRLPKKMPHLLNIRLTHFVGHIMLDTIVNNAENLVKLELTNTNPASITMKNGTKPNMNVKYLAVCFGHYSTVSAKTRADVVKHFILAFPELECFMMRQVSDKTLGQILGGWPKLKTLNLATAFGLTDSGLTGIPVAELSKMTKLENRLSCGCCLPFPVVDSKPNVDNVRQYPHIGKLSDLVELTIESKEGSHFPLSNFSLHLGVHELTKLESLKITCHNELGPHWCLKCIADNLPNLKELTVMDRAISHDRYEEHEVLYLLRRLPNLKLNLIPTNISGKAF